MKNSDRGVPALESILKLRGDPEIFKSVFARQLLPCAVGKHKFRKNKNVRVLSEWATISDEAFALLAFENGHKRWESQCNGDTSLAGTMYTLNGSNARKGQGWTKSGLDRFRDLYKMVQKDRRDNGGVDLELFRQFKEEGKKASLGNDNNPWGASVEGNEEVPHDTIAESDNGTTIVPV